MCIQLVYWVYLAVFQNTWAINVWTMENVPFMVTGESPASESPFEISRDDIAIETRITNFQLTDRALLAETEVRETCRALHLATKTYALTQEKWYHKPFKSYTLEEPIFVNGQYEPCSNWKVDQTIDVALKYKNVDGAPFITHFKEHNLPSISIHCSWNRNAIQSHHTSGHCTSVGYTQERTPNNQTSRTKWRLDL